MKHLLLLILWLWTSLAPSAGAAEWGVDRGPLTWVMAPALPPDWLKTPGTYLSVHAPPDSAATALVLARHGAEALPRLAAALALPLGPEVHVVLAAGDERFQRLQGGRVAPWAAATAWPQRGWIFLRSPGAPERMAVLEHELVHVLLGRAFAPHRPPTWLDEGLAQVASGEWTPARQAAYFAENGATSPPALVELERGFPREARAARLAYGASADFVSWFEGEYGEAALHTLIRQLAAGKSATTAIRLATGEAAAKVEATWAARFARPSWSLGAEDSLWFAVGLMGLASVLVARRRQLRRRAALFAEEAATWGWRHPVR